MRLVLEKRKVEAVELSQSDGLSARCLRIDGGALADTLKREDARVRGVKVHAVAPGESARVYCCKDVIQPAVKLDGDAIGEGRRAVLDGVAVVTCGPIVGFQEGIIDMAGPGAGYSPFSELNLVVLEVEVEENTSPHEHESALRAAGLKAAELIGRIGLDLPPDELDEIDWGDTPVADELPRVVYVYMVLSQGLLHDTWVLGRLATEGMPMYLSPQQILDGGVVSGNCVSACDKHTSYHHANNPVVKALLDGHGSRWNFAGVVITNQPIRLADKEQSARSAAALACELKPDGAIVTKEGFGNPDADFMTILRLLEQADVKCVGVTDEYAGTDGGSQSLADSTAEAVAIVSTGNANQKIVLPPMERTIGQAPDVERLAGGYAGCLGPDGSLEVELQAIMGATNEMGFSHLSACGV